MYVFSHTITTYLKDENAPEKVAVLNCQSLSGKFKILQRATQSVYCWTVNLSVLK